MFIVLYFILNEFYDTDEKQFLCYIRVSRGIKKQKIKHQAHVKHTKIN